MRDVNAFRLAEACEDWLLWTVSTPLSVLQDKEEETICTVVNESIAAPVYNVPQRNRYNDVIHRFDRAVKQAASFSKWSSE